MGLSMLSEECTDMSQVKHCKEQTTLQCISHKYRSKRSKGHENMDIYSPISNIYKGIKRCRHLQNKQEMSNRYAVGKQASQQQIILDFLVRKESKVKNSLRSNNLILHWCGCHISCLALAKSQQQTCADFKLEKES